MTHFCTTVNEKKTLVVSADFFILYARKEVRPRVQSVCALHRTNLSIVDHVYAMIDNILGVFTEEVEDVLHLRFVRKATESYAILARA